MQASEDVLANFEARERAALEGVVLWPKVAHDEGDLARGASGKERAYFWGVPADIACGTRLPTMTKASGMVVVFLRSVAKLTRAQIGVILHHELRHALGETEEQVIARGLYLPEDRHV